MKPYGKARGPALYRVPAEELNAEVFGKPYGLGAGRYSSVRWFLRSNLAMVIRRSSFAILSVLLGCLGRWLRAVQCSFRFFKPFDEIRIGRHKDFVRERLCFKGTTTQADQKTGLCRDGICGS
jgi:hypothetical protein